MLKKGRAWDDWVETQGGGEGEGEGLGKWEEGRVTGMYERNNVN